MGRAGPPVRVVERMASRLRTYREVGDPRSGQAHAELVGMTSAVAAWERRSVEEIRDRLELAAAHADMVCAGRGVRDGWVRVTAERFVEGWV